jgi:hypothetical protein
MASLKYAPLVVCSVLLPIVGCGPGGVGSGDQQDVYPVTGKITMNGAPVAGATVTFSPQQGQPVAYGRTNSSGEYALTTYEANDGAAEGDYIVLVAKSAGGGSEGPSEEEMHEAMTSGEDIQPGGHGAAGGGDESAGSLLPEKYSSQADSGLTATVTSDGENKFDFDLQP